jgi:thiosulfate dehydrogenase
MNLGGIFMVRLSALALAGLFFVTTSGCRGGRVYAGSAAMGTDTASAPTGLAARGKLIFDQTPRFAQPWVGNRLACSDCHLRSGTADYSAPMIDLAGLFPMFNARAGHVISLENRIQECFSRSEAGKPLPASSLQMKALVAYIDWLSRDEVKGKPYPGRGLVKLPALTGDPVRGSTIYTSKCAGCHGTDGAGVGRVLPAVWGKDSYNDGAGMDKPAKMAAFVFHNMPQSAPGTLTPQEAYDVSTFIHMKPRPQFNQAYKN